MTKKWFSMFVLLVVLVGMLAMTADARRTPPDPRIERAHLAKKVAQLDDGRIDPSAAARGMSTVSLGAAQPTVDSRGVLMAQTYRDFLNNSTGGRTIDHSPNLLLPAVQAVYMAREDGPPPNVLSVWGFAAYQAATGTFIPAGGQSVVQIVGAGEAGSYPHIYVDNSGRAMIAGHDFPDGINADAYVHVVRDANPLARNFGTILDGSVMDYTLNQSGNLFPANNNEAIWPTFDVYESGGVHTMYVCVFENDANADDGAMKVFKKSPWSQAIPDNTWQLVFVDTTWFPTQDISVSRTTGKVGVAWIKQTPAGRTAGDTSDQDIWCATSADGGATWTRTNVTSYTGAGYRAWLELCCLYDSSEKLHVIWNGSYTDGADFGSRSCRLFHWSEWNPSNIYTIYDAPWDVLTTDCWGGTNVMNVGKFSIGECDGRLYTIFSSWNDESATGKKDDCCKSSGAGNGANGEVFVSVSKDLQGKSWDFPRNISKSYSPACDTGTCTDDRWGTISRFGMDSALYGTQNWAGAVTINLDTTGPYTGSKYIQVWYMTDRYPGNAVLSSGAVGPVTLNDMRWVRLACVQPVTAALLSVSPNRIDYPEFTKPGIAENFTIRLENTGNTTLNFTSITDVMDSTKGPGTNPVAGWMAHSGAPASLLEGESANMTLTLNAGGVVNTPNVPKVLFGKLRFNYTTPARTLELPVRMTVADSIKGTTWDTITTQCGVALAVGTNGNMGRNFAGLVNMNFPPLTVDCDTGILGRGDAEIYLGDASPVIVKKVGTDYVASWAIFDDGYETPNGFKPLVTGVTPHAAISNAHYDGFFSGVFVNRDSSVKIEKTWFAPKAVDSCSFIVQRMKVYPYNIGASVAGLAIGEAFDFDVPSDTGNTFSANVGGATASSRLIWMRGFKRTDSTFCTSNAERYAGVAFLFSHMKNCTIDSTLYGAYNARNDSFVYPENGFVPSQLWANMQTPGYAQPAGNPVTDLHSVITYKNVATTGYTLPANDTLTIWSAIVVNYSAATNGGDDSLVAHVNKAKKWLFNRKNDVAGVWDRCNGAGPTTCCGTDGTLVRGNVDMSGIVDLGDLSFLVDYLSPPSGPALTCQEEANVDGAGIVDLGDLSFLVDYLSPPAGPALPACP